MIQKIRLFKIRKNISKLNQKVRKKIVPIMNKAVQVKKVTEQKLKVMIHEYLIKFQSIFRKII